MAKETIDVFTINNKSSLSWLFHMNKSFFYRFQRLIYFLLFFFQGILINKKKKTETGTNFSSTETVWFIWFTNPNKKQNKLKATWKRSSSRLRNAALFLVLLVLILQRSPQIFWDIGLGHDNTRICRGRILQRRYFANIENVWRKQVIS